MLETRQEQLFQLVIENYIKTAEPVGSQFLAKLGDLGVSGATIRNELSELEKQGYLTHPHTSAGRIPTELGYKYYVDHLEEQTPVSKNFQKNMEILKNQIQEAELLLKELGKRSAAFTHNAVIIAFGNDRLYYTGMSYLFAQPEFENVNQTIRVSSIFDHCEEHIPELFAQMQDSETVFIGSENPLGNVCSTVAIKMNSETLFALLGPLRMDYKKNLGIVQYVKHLMNKEQ